jgi:hypothetical protein
MATLSIPIIIRVTAPAAPPPPPEPPPPNPEGFTAVDPAAEVTVTFGDFTATIGDVTGWGYYRDGMPYVTVAPGATCTMGAKTPATEVAPALIRHGQRLNPTRNNNGTAPTLGVPLTNNGLRTSEGWMPAYDAAATMPLPQVLEAGDVVLFGVGSLTSAISGVQAFRDGFLDDQAWLHVRDTVPAAGTFSPPAFWHPDVKKQRPTRVVDLAAVMAWLPSLSTAGMTRPLTWAQLAPMFDRPAATRVAVISVGSSGYEAWTPRGFVITGGSNYDPFTACLISQVCNGLIGDSWSAGDKEAALVRMLQHGCQWAETLMHYGDWWVTDGGHKASMAAPMALWLAATGQLARARRAWDFALSGNLPGQYFSLTADDINQCHPHSDTSRPHFAFLRTVSSVTGNVIRVPRVSGENQNITLQGMRLRRPSDGATALVTNVGYPANALDITIDAQPSPAFAPSHVVHCEPVFTPTAGDPEWSAKGRLSSWNWFTFSPDSYRKSQSAQEMVLFLEALQILPTVSTWPATADYVEASAQDNYPVSTPIEARYWTPTWRQYASYGIAGLSSDWQNHWGVQMYATHHATLKPNASARFTLPTFAPEHLDHWLTFAAGTVFQERTGQFAATPAAVGDPVGTIVNLGTFGGYWTAPSDAARPILRETGGKRWLEFDGVDDVIDYRNRSLFLQRGYHIFADVAEISGSANWATFFSALQINGNTAGGIQFDLGDGATLLNSRHRDPATDGTSMSAAGAGLYGRAVAELSCKVNLALAIRSNGANLASANASAFLPTDLSRLAIGARATAFTYQGFAKIGLYGFCMAHSGDVSDTDAATVRTAMG